MQFSLKGYFDALSAYPEQKVLRVIAEQYEVSSFGKIFNNNFIPCIELQMLGLEGFKKVLYNIAEINEDFLEENLEELRSILLSLKMDGDY